jgi:phosphoglycerate dehydrogenase-like enzyme
MKAERLRVLVPDIFGPRLAEVLREVAMVNVAPDASDTALTPLLGDADALISGRFSRQLAQAAPRLRLIHTPGAGTDGLDLDAIPEHITVCNVFGHEAGIAEYVVLTMLALNRDLIRTDRALRAGDWGDREPQREVRGRTLAMVGLGRIGAQVVRYARVLGMNVIGVTRTPDARRQQELGLARLGGMADLHTMLADADFVVLAVPLTPETDGLIGARELRSMRPTAYLINVGRGGLVDEHALYRALRESWIAGAAIDVWYHYATPGERRAPANEPFHELDNIIMTPHVAGWTDGTVRYRWAAIADNLRRLANGEPLQNVVRAGRTR